MEQTPEIIEVNTLALSVPEQAKMITKIMTAEQYQQAANILLSAKEILKQIDKTFKPIKQKMDAAKKEVLEQEKAAAAPLAQAEAYLKPLMIEYTREQERIRREEERRLQEQARKEEEERRLLEAIEAEKNGQQDEAQAIIDAPVQAPPVVVPKTVPKVAGISQRENWKFRIVDEKKIPREFLRVDEVKIGAYVRAMKSAGNIPGVEIYNEATIGAGRRAA